MFTKDILITQPFHFHSKIGKAKQKQTKKKKNLTAKSIREITEFWLERDEF